MKIQRANIHGTRCVGVGSKRMQFFQGNSHPDVQLKTRDVRGMGMIHRDFYFISTTDLNLFF